MASKDSLELGRIGAPYGIKGWVHVQSFTNPPEKLLKYRSWSLSAAHVERVRSVQPAGVAGELGSSPAAGATRAADAASDAAAASGGPTFKVVEGRVQGNGLVARLEGIEDRDKAALLQGSIISVLRSALPKLRKREFYQADLIGLSVANLEGVALGEVSHFVETPGGDVMVVRSDAGPEHWVPATKEHLSKVDLAAGQVVVDWPAVLE
jgi:16S rRNA processing protein RimM